MTDLGLTIAIALQCELSNGWRVDRAHLSLTAPMLNVTLVRETDLDEIAPPEPYPPSVLVLGETEYARLYELKVQGHPNTELLDKCHLGYREARD